VGTILTLGLLGPDCTLRTVLGSGLSYFSGATVYSENRTTSKVVPLWPCLSNRIRRVWHLHDDGASWKSTDI